ncbi:MAG: hypothetical protein KC431_12880, partial [Myxococcales bacterium]|nr:hypothetical protein [Myxococcales bacterium]
MGRFSDRGPGLLRAAAFLALALAPGLGASGCKSKDGQACRCASDCRDGLVCVINDRDVLAPDECAINLEVG